VTQLSSGFRVVDNLSTLKFQKKLTQQSIYCTVGIVKTGIVLSTTTALLIGNLTVTLNRRCILENTVSLKV